MAVDHQQVFGNIIGIYTWLIYNGYIAPVLDGAGKISAITAPRDGVHLIPIEDGSGYVEIQVCGGEIHILRAITRQEWQTGFETEKP